MKSLKAVLFATLIALMLTISGRADATVSLLPGATWCPTSAFTLGVGSVAIYTTVAYNHSTVGTCQILSISTQHNYSVADLGVYGLLGPDEILSVQQGANVQGVYYPNIYYGGSYFVMDYGQQTYSTTLGFGWFPSSFVFHRR